MKRQHGFAATTIIYGLLAAGVVSGALYIVHSYNSALEDNATLTANNAQLTTANQTLADSNAELLLEKEVLDKLLAVRQTQRNNTAALERKLDDALAKILSSDATARDWAATPVPDSILHSLHNDTKRDGSVQGGEAVPAPKSVTPPSNSRVAF